MYGDVGGSCDCIGADNGCFICRNTDYVLVPKEKVADAVKALEGYGWRFDDSVSHLKQ